MSDCEIVRTYDEKVVLSLTVREAGAVRFALEEMVGRGDGVYSREQIGICDAIACDIEETIDGLEHGQGDDEDE